MLKLLSMTGILASLLLLGCTGTTSHTLENTSQLCSDKIDNDGNGALDCADPSCAAFCVVAVADSFATPPHYDFGILPTQVNYGRLKTVYKTWLAAHYVEDAATQSARIKFQGNGDSTVSEGIAYAMLIMVAMDDTPDRFLKLWKYYKDHENFNGVMNWKILKFNADPTPNGYNGATDAEIDAVTALLIASHKYSSVALYNEAFTLAQSIRDHEIDDALYLKPGDGWSNPKNPGYTGTGTMNLLAAAFPSMDWLTVVDSNYSFLGRIQNSANGVIPDWVNVDGSEVPPPPGGGGKRHDFYLEAVRMPWRLALDYFWFGSPKAMALNKKFADYLFISSGGDPGSLKDGVRWDGTPGYWNPSTSSVTAAAASAYFKGSYCMAFTQDPTKQAYVDGCFAGLLAGTDNSYYGQTLQLVFAVTLSGLLPRPYP